jgi:hypothetical protein
MMSKQTKLLIFKISPLIRITLLSLYFALTIPLPFLAKVSSLNIPPWILWLGIALGAVIILGILSEQVILDEQQIQVSYPPWVKVFFPQGWSLSWSEITDLKMRTTGQGGLVYYFVTQQEERAYLLPMRIAGFAQMVREIERKTGIDTNDIRPLSQPWMYLILLVFTLFLLLIDTWTIFNAMTITN